MKLKWGLVLSVFGSIGLLTLVAIFLEKREAVDPLGPEYEWGSRLAHTDNSSAEEMVLIQAGEYILGDEETYPNSKDAPPHRVRLDAFYIDKHEVTNRLFSRFVTDTGYKTTVEKEGAAWIYRGGEGDWLFVDGAHWQHPLGPGSHIHDAMDHPVVLVSWYDAVAYAEWAGKRLPTEAEWEVAARAGVNPQFPNDNHDNLIVHRATVQTSHSSNTLDTELPLHPSAGSHSEEHVFHKKMALAGHANIWQGHWPRKNEMVDGFFYTSPVGSFAANEIGIFDMIGNVWEWTADWYTSNSYETKTVHENPAGASTGSRRVARGGSWFCSPNYCSAYRPGFRGKSPPSSAFNNVGFRCARDVEKI